MVSPVQSVCQRLRPQSQRQQDGGSPLPLFRQGASGVEVTTDSSCSSGLSQNNNNMDSPRRQGQHRHHGPVPGLDHTRKALGLGAQPPQSAVRKMANTHMKWNRIRLILREPILEFWGVFIFILFGDSVIAQWKLSNGEYGNWVTVCFGWGIGLMFGIYVAGDSGAYLNPAVTLTNCIFRGIPLKRFPIYTASQVLGAFCAHAITYANFFSAINEYEGGAGIRTVPPSETATAGIFCSFPVGENVPKGSQVLCDFIANFILMFCILALRDENGADLKGGGGNFVFAVGWLNFVLFACFGWLTASPINPGRDFAGRVWLTIMGYEDAWTTMDNWSWVPIFIPFLACFTGGLFYDFFIYTGESPINADGWGLSGVWYLVTCGRSRKAPHQQTQQNATADHGDGMDPTNENLSDLEQGFGTVGSLEKTEVPDDQGRVSVCPCCGHIPDAMQTQPASGNPQRTPTAKPVYESSRVTPGTEGLEHKEDKDTPYDASAGGRSHIQVDHGFPSTESIGLSRRQNSRSNSDYFGRRGTTGVHAQRTTPQQSVNPEHDGVIPESRAVHGAVSAAGRGVLNTATSRMTQPKEDSIAEVPEQGETLASRRRTGAASQEGQKEQLKTNPRRWQWSSRWTDAELGRKVGKDSYYGYSSTASKGR